MFDESKYCTVIILNKCNCNRDFALPWRVYFETIQLQNFCSPKFNISDMKFQPFVLKIL